MFERYTEMARRAIFFARYEASQFGSSSIETEHLLLGLIREDQVLANRLLQMRADLEGIRKQIESRSSIRDMVSTSIDLPLSPDSRRVLAYANQESEALGHTVIDGGHLVLGLLRVETSTAAAVLREHGIEHAEYREIVRSSPLGSLVPEEQFGSEPTRPVDRPSAWSQPYTEEFAAPSLRSDITALQRLIDQAIHHLHTSSDEYGEQRLKRKPWSRKEALGRLIDLATAHHQWLARALTEPKLVESGYPSEDRVAAQQYGSFAWQDVVDLWVGMNRLLLHVMALIPEEKLSTRCRIGIQEPVTLLALIHRYVEQCEDIVGQVLARL